MIKANLKKQLSSLSWLQTPDWKNNQNSTRSMCKFTPLSECFLLEKYFITIQLGMNRCITLKNRIQMLLNTTTTLLSWRDLMSPKRTTSKIWSSQTNKFTLPFQLTWWWSQDLHQLPWQAEPLWKLPGISTSQFSKTISQTTRRYLTIVLNTTGSRLRFRSLWRMKKIGPGSRLTFKLSTNSSEKPTSLMQE